MHQIKRMTWVWLAVLGWLAGPDLLAQSWAPQVSGTTGDLGEIFMVTDEHGWAFRRRGPGFRVTHDGGQTWLGGTQGVFPAEVQVQDSYFADTLQGIVVGKYDREPHTGWMARTNDGGLSWAVDTVTFSRELTGISFADPLRGWVCGREGRVYRTTDGGLSWTLQPTSVTEDLHGIWFADSLHGICVGESGTLLYTTQGGTAWMQGLSFTDEDLLAVTMADSLRGWAAGEKGTLLYTFDGGQFWLPQLAFTDRDLHDVSFLNDSTGWVAGDQGVLRYTTSSGLVWLGQASQTERDILSLAVSPGLLGWFSGDEGVIHHTGSGNATALTPALAAAVRVFPNPATERIILDLPAAIPATGMSLHLVQAATGQDCLRVTHIHDGANEVDLEGLAPGLYGWYLRGPEGLLTSGRLMVRP